MALSSLLLMLIGGVGMTVIIVEGEIFVPIKNLLKKVLPEFVMKMMNCHQCCGFWSGLFVSSFFLTPSLNSAWYQIIHSLGSNFVAGCAVSLLSYLWAYVVTFIEANTVIRS